MPLHSKILTLAFAGLFAGVAQPAVQDDVQDVTTSQDAAATTLPAVTRGSQLMGIEVVASLDGERLGTLEDVVLDADGKLALGLVRLSSGDGEHPLEAMALSGVPMRVLTLETAPDEPVERDDTGADGMREDRMLLGDPALQDAEDAPDQQLVCQTTSLLKSAPTLASLDALDAEWLGKVQEHYGLAWKKGDGSKPDHVLLGRLVGAEVRGQDDAELGRIADLALDVQAMTVRYAAIETDSTLGLGGDLHALHIEPAQLDDDKRSITVDLDEQSVDRLPALPEDAPWPKEPLAISSGEASGGDRG
ncbi:MAG: PRC-barrel domain-containing protein [Planctomycetes bacterium]|nr:PRC-barrel domain-containing protein [Planctomycetota bacterium]